MEKWKNGKIYSGKTSRMRLSIFPFFHFSDIRERTVTRHVNTLPATGHKKNGKMEKSLS
jgi:hypothetical protein